MPSALGFDELHFAEPGGESGEKIDEFCPLHNDRLPYSKITTNNKQTQESLVCLDGPSHNERFGLELGDADQLLFDQFEESWAADETLGAQARANDFQNFRLVFDREFLSTIVGRVDQNDAIFKKILDDEDFKQTLLEFYAARLYERLRRDDQLGLAPA